MHGGIDVGKPAPLIRDDEDGRGDTLQDLHLSEDDWTAFDHEPALVGAAEAAGPAPGENRGGNQRRGHSRDIMTEAHIGRLLAASLHQAIGELLPLRLEFYEVWLRSEGLRNGSIGAAPISAVLGFLRTEPQYHEIVGLDARLGERRQSEWVLRRTLAAGGVRCLSCPLSSTAGTAETFSTRLSVKLVVDRAEERAGPEDVGDQALMRGLVTAFPFVRPGLS